MAEPLSCPIPDARLLCVERRAMEDCARSLGLAVDRSGYRMKDVAARAGRAPSLMSKMTSFGSNPRLRTLARVAEAMNARLVVWFLPKSADVHRPLGIETWSGESHGWEWLVGGEK